MSKKMNNTWLVIILAVLAVILVLTKLIKEPREQSTLKTDLIAIDTSKVSKILMNKGVNKDNTIEFDRKGDTWTVSQGAITSKEEKGSANGIIESLVTVKPQRLVATSKSKWNDYELTDSTATEITFMNNDNKTMGSIMIGKFTYNQPSNSYAAYGRGGYSGTSYVRIPGENNVYAVEGFLSMMLRRNFNSWRDKTFTTADRKDITKVTFSYPADSSFVLSYKDSTWYAADNRADSLKTSEYLGRLSSSQGATFKDQYTPDQPPVYSLKIEGNNMQPINIACYPGNGADEYIMHSSQNPDIYFESGKTGLFDQLLKTERYFTKGEKK